VSTLIDAYTDPKHLLRFVEMKEANAREGMLNLLNWMMDLEQTPEELEPVSKSSVAVAPTPTPALQAFAANQQTDVVVA